MTSRPAALLLCALAWLGPGCRRAAAPSEPPANPTPPAPVAAEPAPAPAPAPASAAAPAPAPESAGPQAAPAPAAQAPEPAAPPRAAEVSPRPARPPAVGLAGDPEEGVVYRWEDADGVHYGHGFEIPPAQRKRARPVDAAVGSISVEEAPPPAGPAAGSAAPADAAPAAPPAAPGPEGGAAAAAKPPRTHYQRAVDLATGRPSEDRPPDPKCHRENGVLLCDP